MFNFGFLKPALDAGLQSKVDELERTLLRISLEHAPATHASSLSIEDMVVTHVILRRSLDISIFTLDTGRMHADTLALVKAVEDKYRYAIKIVKPDADAVAQYESAHGRDAFYASVDLRKSCCTIRKVEPLARALAGHRAWITGMRRAQSVTRDTLKLHERDTVHDMDKFNPLADWTEDEVWAYLRAYKVPYNKLYDQGYRSIGCAPCSRPTVAGEDVRAGRWWWEQPEARECGLHLSPDGKLVRIKAAA
jgi:phosphoadenosine phosphosulfate reductase